MAKRIACGMCFNCENDMRCPNPIKSEQSEFRGKGARAIEKHAKDAILRMVNGGDDTSAE